MHFFRILHCLHAAVFLFYLIILHFCSVLLYSLFSGLVYGPGKGKLMPLVNLLTVLYISFLNLPKNLISFNLRIFL